MPRLLLLLSFFWLWPAAMARSEDVFAGDARDAILLLADGPVHIRFHLTLAGKSLTQCRQEFISNLMQRLDSDGNGRLSIEEWEQSPLHRFGKKQVSNEFLKTLGEQRTVTRRDVERDLLRFGELVSYRQDDSAAGNDQQVFALLDADHSGRVDASEMQQARKNIAALDADRDQCVSFGEFVPPPPAESPMTSQIPTGLLSEELPSAFLASLMRDTADLRLGLELLRTYDRDQDRFLTPSELGGGPERLAALDSDGDGRLGLRELRDLQRLPADLVLQIDLAGGTRETLRPFHLVSSAAGSQAPSPRSDLIRLAFGTTSVTFAFRMVDPIQQALENARQRFNLLDVDSNGYLDRKEIAGNSSFERIWFHAMDANQDDMLYAEEVQNYVVAICEPAASTCHVNIYDVGPGYFQLLDSSGDGRISLRELKAVQTSLALREKSPGAGITPADMGRNYFVEFVRGSYQVFGASQRMQAQGLEFIERAPIGPGWFQAIDRNRDGDLTYLPGNPLYPPEFLFSLEIAREMDRDHDGLISWEEAEHYDHQRPGQSSDRMENTALLPGHSSDP